MGVSNITHMPWDGEVEPGDLWRCTGKYTSPTFNAEVGDQIMVHRVSPADAGLVFVMQNKDQANQRKTTLPRLRLPSLIKYFIFVRSYNTWREELEELICMGLSTAEKFWILHESRAPRKKLKPHGVNAPRTMTARADWEEK